LSAGNLPNMLAELLKSVGYNHAPFYLGTWAQFTEVNRYGMCRWLRTRNT
jgi:hypothetical protein